MKSSYTKVSNNFDNYTVFKIPKDKNNYRIIYKPYKNFKKKLRNHLPYLEKKFNELDVVNANYAFIKNKNCALNAMQHIGFNNTISMDLENFFDNITIKHVDKYLSKEVITDCFISGAPRQGLPTSPLISSIAFLQCDNDIQVGLESLNIKFQYTRYADDLYVSFNDLKDVKKISDIIEKAISSNKFTINHNKTKVQTIKNGRIIITGIAIDEIGIYATRKTKKKIRAAIHQKNYSSCMGLKEWSKLKLPSCITK